MVGIVTLISISLTLIGLILGYIYYINSTRPTAYEISDAAHRRSPPNQLLGTNLHLIRVIKIGVIKNNDWLEEYDNPEEQRIRAYFEGMFIGKAEVILHFEKPPMSPPQDELENHPYYRESLTFEGERTGTGPLDIEATDQSLKLTFGIYANTVEQGAAAVSGMLILVSNMIDQLIEEQMLDRQISIPPINEVLDEERLSDGKEPILSVDDIPEYVSESE